MPNVTLTGLAESTLRQVGAFGDDREFRPVRDECPGGSCSLHGFNGGHLPKRVCYRVVPHGNKVGVNVQFSLFGVRA